jgi:NAD(P)-dependent dehydrogenase (short-subunit alcohol dehydrogenase family)
MSSQRKTAIVTGASQGIGAGIVHGFVAAAANRWIGVSQAGYACREALPVVLLLVSWPSAVALCVTWQCL